MEHPIDTAKAIRNPEHVIPIGGEVVVPPEAFAGAAQPLSGVSGPDRSGLDQCIPTLGGRR